jgi:hypothetical protein
MKLEIRNDDNLMISDKELGSYFNATDRMVLLRVPDADELRQLWNEFDREIRCALKGLLLQPYGDIVDTLGYLGFNKKNAEERKDELFGMLTQNSVKSAQFLNGALFKAAIALDLIPDKKPNGQSRKRLAPGEGSIIDQVLAMSRDDQKAIIATIVEDHESLDEWMRVSQGSAVGWGRLRNRIKSSTDTAAFLDKLADETDRLMGDDGQRTVRYANSDDKIEYAPTWFAQFLSKRKVWVWPARYSARIMFMYPSRFSPLIARMSVTNDRRDFADSVFRYHQDQRHTGAAVSLQAFAVAALCGNTWETGNSPFRWYPLVAFKERAPSLASANHILGSINAVYKLAVEFNGDTVKRRTEAHYFVNSARLAKIGVDAFNWTLHPTPRNTQVASRLLECPVEVVPRHVKSWASQLRELLPVFGVKTIKMVENPLNYWLVYLMTLDPKDAPTDFQTIVRTDHVHDLQARNTHTFWNFLDYHFPEDKADMGNRAIAAMRKAFHLAASRDGFKSANPFDAKLDRIGAGYSKGTDITHRKPLELEAWELIVQKNRENDYGFARSLGPNRFHYKWRNPVTGKHELVFWPAEAIVVDFILNSGMRHISARWADSGEGDEKRIDRENMRLVPNDHPAATPRRRECFLQLVDLSGVGSRKIFGQRVGINKSGKPYVIPWVDSAVADGFYRMLDLQMKYNPISKSVKPIKDRTRDITRVNPELFPDIFPLFRDPSSNGDKAISDTKVLSYWKDLLRHCQVDVNALYGQEYPLITEDGAVFDLHALRVTMVTNLLEAGVSPQIVQDLAGHATWMMTWHYNAKRSTNMNLGIQEVMAKRAEAHARLAARDKDAIEEYAAEAVVPDFVQDHVGADMLRKYKSRRDLPPFEIFLHGICPGGSCSTGGERNGQRFMPVWRERACSGCRYRVTGPKFKHGIQNKINNLLAELKLSEQRAQELSRQIEQEELRTGKENHALRGLQHSENRFKNRLTEELAKEVSVQRIVHEVEEAARAAGLPTEDILLPASTDFDPANVGYGFTEVHEFELFYTLTKETRLLPAAVLETEQGIEAHMKKLLKTVLRNHSLAELLAPLTDREETDACLLIGGRLLELYPEANQFQKLIEGTILLDHEVVQDIRARVDAVLAATPKRPQIGHAA